MPHFGRLSQQRLKECHPSLRLLFDTIIQHFDCSILCGCRPEAEQNRLFDLGRSRVKWPNSKHNQIPSIAIDVVPYYVEEPHIRWDKESLTRYYYFAGWVKGLAAKLQIDVRWGGDWDMDTLVRDQTFNDLPHFELIL